MTIYNDYSEEPQDIFLELPTSKYVEFYGIEMDSFQDDLPFYCKYLPSQEIFLELGCGTGRLGKYLQKQQFFGLGIDISLKMLQKNPNSSVLCGDIRNFSLQKKFEAILAPYNILNLLYIKEDLLSCLKQVHEHLSSSGVFLIDLRSFEAQSELAEKKKTFQFQIIDSPKARIVKEILRTFHPEKNCIEIEERYRYRPKDRNFKDYKNTYTINAFSFDQWCDIFTQSGFRIQNIHHDYSMEEQASNQGHQLFVLKK